LKGEGISEVGPITGGRWGWVVSATRVSGYLLLEKVSHNTNLDEII